MKQASIRQPLLLAAVVASIAVTSADAQEISRNASIGTRVPPAPIATANAAGLPQDWSSRSIVYSDASADTPSRSASGDWQTLYRNPRYALAMARHAQAIRTTSNPSDGSPSILAGLRGGTALQALRDSRRGHPSGPSSPTPETGMARDWSNALGGGTGGVGGRGMDGVFPAKYNFDILATPSCANDFVVYPTGTAGASEASPTYETYVSSFTGDPGQGSSSTVTVGLAGSHQVVLTSSATDNTGKSFLTSGVDNNTRAQNLANAVNRWTGQTGFRAEVSGAQVTVIATTAGDISNSALVENLANFSGGSGWPGVNGAGTAGQPTITGFNQLYQGTGTAQASGPCNGTWNQNGATKAPNVMWAYNTGTAYIAETSPTLSYLDNGKQVAFIQRNGNTLQLVLLKWRAGQGTATAPATPTLSADAATYRACADNCYLAITLSGTSNTGSTATYSAPFVDYASDTLWVGDGNGQLHKFTGVFQGNPAEVTTGGFPATVASGLKLSPPVYYAGNVYVGSQSGAAGLGGMMHRVDATNGAVVSSAKLANNNNPGLRDTPLVVVSGNTASVYGFLFNDGTAGDGTTCTIATGNDNACRVVARFAPDFAAGAAPLQRAYVGRGNNSASTLYAGSFDDAFYASSDGTGAMYIVGGAVADTFVPTLWKIPINAGVMGTPVAGAVVGSKTCSATCTTATWNWSPVTLVNGSAGEYLYFSMGTNANLTATGCTGACLYMFNLGDLNGPSTAGTGAAWGTGNVAWAGLQVFGGTGGIAFDNVSTTTGAAQIYFSHTATTGNAVQASQAALD